jgi:hypothetical protein
VQVLRLFAICLVLVCGSLMSAGCGSGFPASSTSPSGSIPAQKSIPLSLVHIRGGESYCLLVNVSVGGGPSVPVVVDTGSPGLLLDSGAVGPGAQPTGRSVRDGFVGTPQFTVPVMTAKVIIGGVGGVSTPAPVVIGSIVPTATNLLNGFSGCGGAKGLIGIGVGYPDPAVPPLESPLVQLASPLSDGYTIKLTGNAGTLLLGKPVISPTSVSLPLLKEEGTYPSGQQAYQRDVTLCWTVGAVHRCGLTSIDSGFSFPAIRPGFMPPAPYQGYGIPPGTRVSITAPNGAQLRSFTTATSPPDVRLAFAHLSGLEEANTGIGFFFSNSVGFDVSTGQAVITPD